MKGLEKRANQIRNNFATVIVGIIVFIIVSVSVIIYKEANKEIVFSEDDFIERVIKDIKDNKFTAEEAVYLLPKIKFTYKNVIIDVWKLSNNSLLLDKITIGGKSVSIKDDYLIADELVDVYQGNNLDKEFKEYLED